VSEAESAPKQSPSPVPGFADRMRTRIESMEQYAALTAMHMERPNSARSRGAPRAADVVMERRPVPQSAQLSAALGISNRL
jgi:hypothetical protein